MNIIRTRKERLQEQAQHPGQNHYKIFYKDSDEKRIQVSDFWASGRNEAYDTLEVFKRKQALVDPDDNREYFYGTKGGFITDAGNGLEAEHDEMSGWLNDEKETFLEKFRLIFKRIGWRASDCWYALKDFWFFFRHYDMRSNKSHNRNESWSLDSHILDDIEFNVPLIKEDKNGVPSIFCERARAELNKHNKNFDIQKSLAAHPNSSEPELELGKRLWNAELDELLLHVRLYRYYNDHGIFDENDADYVEIDKKYKNTLPYYPGTDEDFDYAKLHELTQAEWEKIWKWIIEYGQALWT